METYPKVSIVILNWNGWQDTLDCLTSVYKNDYPNYEIILIDNNSQNDSLVKIKEWCLKRKLKTRNNFEYLFIKKRELNKLNFKKSKNKFNKVDSNRKLLVIENDTNSGFAPGNNIAINLVLKENISEYILLLNNDTIVKENFLSLLVKAVKNNSSVAIVSPKIYYHNFDSKKNVIWFDGGQLNWKIYPGFVYEGFNTVDNKLNKIKANIEETTWVTGACMLINIERTPKLTNGDLLNSHFRFGGEDIDIFLRVKKNNKKIMMVHPSVIWHKVGKSRPRNFKQIFNSIKTNLKVIKKFDKHFYMHLPSLLVSLPSYYFKSIYYKKLRTAKTEKTNI